MRLLVNLGAEGEMSPDRGFRLLKKPSSEVEEGAEGGTARVQSSKEDGGCKVVAEDLLDETVFVLRTDGK